jgi:hypothetical protein
MVVEQSSEARLGAPSPIGGPLNPGGPSSRTQITILNYLNIFFILYIFYNFLILKFFSFENNIIIK